MIDGNKHTQKEKMGYLSKEALEKIVREPGKYAMEDTSVIAHRLDVWWTYCASLVPARVSANAVTVGAAVPLVLCWLASVVCVWATGSERVPRWLMLCAAAAELFFQTMDAVDGKHARRLGTSSPLGDFLDHVMDSVSIMTTAYLVCSALELACLPLAYVCLVLVSLNFAVIHWESAKTLVMRLDNGSSITEAQLAFTALFLATAAAGPALWHAAPVPRVPALTLGRLAAGGLVGAISLAQCCKSVARVLARCPARAVLPELLVPVAGALAVAAVWLAALPPAHSLVPFQAVLLATTVVHAACITLDRLAAQPIAPTATLPVLVPALLAPLAVPRAHRTLAVAAAAVWGLAYMLHFLAGIVRDIAHALGLPIFAQVPPKKLN